MPPPPLPPWVRNGGGAGGCASLSVRGLIAGGISALAEAVAAAVGFGAAPTLKATEAGMVDAVLTDDIDEDEEATLDGCNGGGKAASPSLSDTILAALVAAELLKLRPPVPRLDASLFDALRIPKNDEPLTADDDDDSVLIEDDGYRGLGASLPVPPTLPMGLPLDSERLLLFRLYCTWDDSEEVSIILSDRRGISGAIC